MRRHLLLITITVAAVLLAGSGVAGGKAAPPGPQYRPGAFLLVSGASLAASMHGSSETAHFDRACSHPRRDATGWGGWPCVLLLKLRGSAPRLQIKNIADPYGEDSCRYLGGRSCAETGIAPSTATPQQAQVLSFLRRHQGAVSPILTDLTGNDFPEVCSRIKRYITSKTPVPEAVVKWFRKEMTTTLQRYERDTDVMLAHMRRSAPRANLILVPPDVDTSYLQGKLTPGQRTLLTIWAQTLTRADHFKRAEAVKFHALFADLDQVVRAEWKAEGLTQRQLAAAAAPGEHMNDLWHRVVGTAVWKAYRHYQQHPAALLSRPKEREVTSASALGDPPAGGAIFRQSLAAITQSLHSVHAEVTDKDRQQGKSARNRITSDCLMTPTSIRGRFWLRGTRFEGPERVDNHYVMMLNWTPGQPRSRIWVRSPRTGNRWQRADSDNTALEFIILCPAWLAQSLQHSSHVLPISLGHVRNLGVAHANGHRTWHLRSATSYGSRKERLDFFVDQRTRYWVRFVQLDWGKTYRRRSVLNYSRFNAPVAIPLPAIGAATP